MYCNFHPCLDSLNLLTTVSLLTPHLFVSSSLPASFSPSIAPSLSLSLSLIRNASSLQAQRGNMCSLRTAHWQVSECQGPLQGREREFLRDRERKTKKQEKHNKKKESSRQTSTVPCCGALNFSLFSERERKRESERARERESER